MGSPRVWRPEMARMQIHWDFRTVKYTCFLLAALCASLSASDTRITRSLTRTWQDAVKSAESGHRDHALELLGEVIDGAPGFLPAREQRARMLFRDGRYADALSDAEEALRLDSSDAGMVL